MKPITVTALRDHVYRGRALTVGEAFDVSPIDAAALRYQGVAALESDADLTAAARARRLASAPDGSVPDVPVLPRQKRRYRRRDLTAQS